MSFSVILFTIIGILGVHPVRNHGPPDPQRHDVLVVWLALGAFFLLLGFWSVIAFDNRLPKYCAPSFS